MPPFGQALRVHKGHHTQHFRARAAGTESPLMLGLALHETAKGPFNPKPGMRLRDEGDSTTNIRLCIDVVSVFSALAVDV